MYFQVPLCLPLISAIGRSSDPSICPSFYYTEACTLKRNKGIGSDWPGSWNNPMSWELLRAAICPCPVLRIQYVRSSESDTLTLWRSISTCLFQVVCSIYGAAVAVSRVSGYKGHL